MKKLKLPKNYPGAQPAKYGHPRAPGTPPPRAGKTTRDKVSRKHTDKILSKLD